MKLRELKKIPQVPFKMVKRQKMQTEKLYFKVESSRHKFLATAGTLEVIFPELFSHLLKLTFTHQCFLLFKPKDL